MAENAPHTVNVSIILSYQWTRWKHGPACRMQCLILSCQPIHCEWLWNLILLIFAANILHMHCFFLLLCVWSLKKKNNEQKKRKKHTQWCFAACNFISSYFFSWTWKLDKWRKNNGTFNYACLCVKWEIHCRKLTKQDSDGEVMWMHYIERQLIWNKKRFIPW